MTARIVGVMGRKRSGKNTFARGLTEIGWREIAFADPLRRMALALDPLVGPVHLRDPETGHAENRRDARLSEVIQILGWEAAKDYVPEVRRTLQRLGTDAVRSVAPTFWVDLAVAEIEASDVPVVVTDVRFPNEADAIRALGGTLVRITRPSLIQVGDDHPTETALDDYTPDLTVVNQAPHPDELSRCARQLASDGHL